MTSAKGTASYTETGHLPGRLWERNMLRCYFSLAVAGKGSLRSIYGRRLSSERPVTYPVLLKTRRISQNNCNIQTQSVLLS